MLIGSVAGHIQVYNAKSKDPLEVMGRMMMGDPDITQLDDFSKVRASSLAARNVIDRIAGATSARQRPAGSAPIRGPLRRA